MKKYNFCFIIFIFLIFSTTFCFYGVGNLSYAQTCTTISFDEFASKLALMQDKYDNQTSENFDICTKTDLIQQDGRLMIQTKNFEAIIGASQPPQTQNNTDSFKPIDELASQYGFKAAQASDKVILTKPQLPTRLIVKSSSKLNNYGAIDSIEGYNNYHIFQYQTPAQADSAYRYYQNLKSVDWVQKNNTFTSQEIFYSTANDTIQAFGTTQQTKWGKDAMEVESYIQKIKSSVPNYLSKEVVVAVLDSGIDTDHPTFTTNNRILYSYGKNFSTSRPAGTYPFEDDHGHGSHVAGIICDLTLPNVKILPIKVLNNGGAADLATIISGLEYVLNLATTTNLNIVAINLSLGDHNFNIMEQQVDFVNIFTRAINQGIVPVVAAGNESEDAMHAIPANTKCAITVGNVGMSSTSGQSEYTISGSSNYGEIVDVVAPGTNILSVNMGGGETLKSGTSMATPHVSAAVALYQTYRTYTPTQIERLLKSNTTDLGEEGLDPIYGYGMPNFSNAYDEILDDVSFSNTQINHSSSFSLRLTSNVSNSKIYYTTNFSEPSKTNGTLYSSSININKSMVVKAVQYVFDQNGKIIKKSNIKTQKYCLNGKDVAEPFTVVNSEITKYKGVLPVVTIPANINNQSIVRIKNSAFKNNTDITKINLPTTLQNIGNFAFCGCHNLNEINLTNVTNLGEAAFYNCKSLKSVNLKKCGKIPSLAFRNCSSLTNVFETANILSIEKNAFTSCLSLKTVSFENATNVGDSALANTSLISINMPNVVTIGVSSFAYNQHLTSAIFPKLTILKAKSFWYSPKLSEMSFPEVTNINSNVFTGCTSLTEITDEHLPKAQSISAYSLAGCTSLTKVSLSSIVTCWAGVFHSSKNLKEVSFSNAITIYSDIFEKCDNIETVNFPNATNIEKRTFRYATSYKNINISKQPIIYADMFKDCSKLEKINVSSATEIQERAFYGCSKLENINASSATTIKTNSFDSCVALKEIFLPKIQTIESSTFDSSGITKFYIGKHITSIFTSTIKYGKSITIYGYTNTAAESFARSNNNTFIAIEDLAFTTNLPSTKAALVNEQIEPLTVETNGLNPTYQWYITEANTATNGEVLQGETNASLTISSDTAGETKYYVVVTDWDGMSITSNLCTVTISNANLTLTFDSNGGSSVNDIHYTTFSNDVTLPSTTRMGYTFVGWFAKVKINGTTHYAGTNYFVSSNPSLAYSSLDNSELTTSNNFTTIDCSEFAQDCEFIAKWQANTNTAYKVQHYFEQLNGTYKLDTTKNQLLQGTTDQTTYATYLDNLTGFINNTSHQNKIESGIIAANGSLVLKLYYSRTRHTIQWKVDDQIIETDTNVMYGATPSYNGVTPTKTTPIAYIHTFNGWTPSTSIVTCDAIYTAQFDSQIKTFKVIFNINGGTLISGNISQTIEYGQNAQAPSVKKIGYTFSGYNSSLENITENKTINAIWTLNTYTITYYLDDGNNSQDNPSCYTIQNLPKFNDAYKYGYDFVGWFDNENFYGSQITQIDTYNLGDICLYAKFLLIKCKLVLKNSNDLHGVINCIDGDLSFIKFGDVLKFEIIPDKTYCVSKVLVNNLEVSISNNTFAITAADRSINLEIIYKKDPMIYILYVAIAAIIITGIIAVFIILSKRKKHKLLQGLATELKQKFATNIPENKPLIQNNNPNRNQNNATVNLPPKPPPKLPPRQNNLK
ncbi:MAG: hypothetical protein E7378_01640 [Clostridiales bacterium]|nr:hypothetical protein [Clostridiales bacterium]